MGASPVILYVLLWCLGVYLRLTVLIVPPLIPHLEQSFGFSTGQVAMATSLPALFIGAGALMGGWLVGRLGAVSTAAGGLVVIAVGSSLRSFPDGYVLFLGATAIMGAGIALLQTSMPVLSRAWMPMRIGRVTAVYTNGLLSGELIAAALTGPLVRHLLGEHWLWAFSVWALPVPLIVVGLIVYARARGGRAVGVPAPAAAIPHLSWSDPLIWKVALLLGAAGGLYFSGNVFLSHILGVQGRIDLLDTGLAMLNGSQLLSSAILIAFADRLLGRRWPLLLVTGGAVSMVPVLFLSGPAGVIWGAAVLGFCTSSMLTFALALPAWLVAESQVRKLAAGAFAIGNSLVFLIPALAGWIKDVTGVALLGFAPAVLVALIAMAATGGMHPRHHGERRLAEE